MLKNIFGRKDFRSSLVEKAIEINHSSQKIIAFADNTDVVLKAASIIKKKFIARPAIIGNSQKLADDFKRLGLSNLDDENVIDHLSEHNKEKLERFSKEYLLLRKDAGKIMSDSDALSKVSLPHYYGAMLVHMGEAQGLISGDTSETKPYYPAFEIIKLAPGVSRTSGAFLMLSQSGSKELFFADCAMNMSPTYEQLAEIAILTSNTCASFGLTPKVAMLSFSTRDSAKHESVERVKMAATLLKRKKPDLLVDGEIQADAALDPVVMQKKCPDSALKGEANVLIFPDLNAANIGYKLVERLGGYEAVGPFLQGLRLPVNDLSRGCGVNEVVHLAAITVIQSKACENHEDIGFSEIKQPQNSAPSASSGSILHASYESVQKSGKHHSSKNSSESAYASTSNPLDNLPSNVRKIIEDSKKKIKKSAKPD